MEVLATRVFSASPGWGLNAGWSALPLHYRKVSQSNTPSVLVEYPLWSNKAVNKDTEVQSNSTLSYLMYSIYKSFFNFVRERGDPFCQSGTRKKGWCDQDRAHSTHSSSKCTGEVRAPAWIHTFGETSNWTVLAFSANSFRKTMSFPGKERLCSWWIKKTPNFLSQSLESLSPGFHLKFLELKAQHSSAGFFPNKCPMKVCDVSGMGKCIFSVL